MGICSQRWESAHSSPMLTGISPSSAALPDAARLLSVLCGASSEDVDTPSRSAVASGVATAALGSSSNSTPGSMSAGDDAGAAKLFGDAAIEARELADPGGQRPACSMRSSNLHVPSSSPGDGCTVSASAHARVRVWCAMQPPEHGFRTASIAECLV